jgi:Protein of unknown function (DUF4232)
MLRQAIAFKSTTLATICCLMLMVAAPGAAAGAPSQGRAACDGRDVVVWLDTQSDAAAGSNFFRLVFTNIGNRVCTLVGFPRVSAVSLARVSLGSAAGRIQSQVGVIRLLAGGSASAILRIAAAGNFPTTACGKVTTAAGLRVSSPDGTIQRVVPFPFSAWSRTGPIFLTTSALSAR